MYVKSSKTGSHPIAIGIGARYLDSELSVWLSVDPLSDMYPSTSPFMYVRGNPVMLVDPDGLSDGQVKGRKPRGNKRWFKHKNRKMGNGQKLVWRHKNAKKSPNERIASASGKIPTIKTGNYNTTPWQNVGTGNNGRTTFTLNRGPNQDYLRSLRVLGSGPGGFVGTAITTTNGGFIDGYFDQFYISSPDGTVVPGTNGMYGGFIPGLSLAANYVAKYFPTKPLSKVVSVIVLALNSQRINPIYRNTHHVNVNRGAWGTNGQYNLQARYRQFNFIDPNNRGNIFKWWYGI
jgi:RHS repeat-associated protein